MGKIKYISNIRKFFKESPVVSMDSLKKFINKKNKKYIYIIINNLIKKKKINKITKGFYTIYEDPSLAVFCFKPSYLGLQDALSVHGLWEQETVPIIITTRKIRPGKRKIFEMNVLLRRIDKKYFFGFDYVKQGDFYFSVSDVEKTLIDMLYFKQRIEPEVLNNFRKRIDRKKFISYLKVYPKKFRKRALGVVDI